jgi:putative ATP-binding cassette transporter
MKGIGTALRDAWRIGAPWFASEEKWRARGLLGAIVGLNLALVGMNVVLSFWNRAFYDALETRNADAFWQLLLTARTLESGNVMPGFVPIVIVYLIVAVYAYYLRQGMEIRWRRWMTTRLMAEWLADRAYYRIQLQGAGSGSAITDNPDQRIAEDLRIYVTDTLTLGLGLMTNIVTLVSFVGILWSLSGAMTVWGIEVPGYMVWMALIYAAAGTWLTHLIGRRLIPLNFEKQRREADFRFALVRLRENTEGVALYGGEADESRRLHQRFAALMDNWWRTMRAQKRLLWFTTGYAQAAVVFPFIVAAPQYLSGGMSLGQLTQTAGAFGRVQDALSWFVDSYTIIAEWRATVARITGFRDAIAASRHMQGPVAVEEPRADVVLEDVTLALPDGRTLLAGAGAALPPGARVLVTGPSGSGKSTLFRALAGIWPFGGGTIRRPADGRALFLPQRPYIPLGTLRAAVAYPDARSVPSGM